MSEDLDKHQSYFSVVPACILSDERVNDGDKVLFFLISSFTYGGRACWASDKYLADRINVSHHEVKKRLRILEDCGYITRETQKNGVLWDRKIYSNYNHEGPMCTPRSTHVGTSKDTYVSQSNISKSKRRKSNTPPRQAAPSPSPAAQEVCDHLFEHLKKRNPKFVIKSPKEWIKNAEKLIKQHADVEYLKKVIDWAFTKEVIEDEDKWAGWKTVIKSPGSLYRHLESIEDKMSVTRSSSAEDNRKWAEKVEREYGPKANERNFEIHVGPNQVEFIAQGAQNCGACFEYDKPKFKEKVKNQLATWELIK